MTVLIARCALQQRFPRNETHFMFLEEVLYFGVDINAQDNDGQTAFHWACRNGNLELVQLLLRRGDNERLEMA